MSNKPTPVLYVHHRPELGGAPNSLLFLIQGLDRRYYQPMVLCPEGPSAQLFRQAGLKVYTSPISNFTHVVDSVYRGARWGLLAYELLKLPSHWQKLRRAIQESGAKIVHLNECTLALSAYLSHRLGCRVVWHVRATLAGGSRRTLIQRCMNNWADVVVAIDEDVHLPLTQVPHTQVIHNSVSLDKFRPNNKGGEVRRALGIPPEAFCVALIGRIRKSKGAFDFIEAVKLIRPELRNRTKFLLVGGSEYPPAFFRSVRGRLIQRLGIRADYLTMARELVSKYGLENNIVFVDFWDDMPSLYDATDIAVFSAPTGGIGRPGFEAAACGKPIIATSITGNSDVVVSDVTGLLIPPADPSGLAQAITRLLEDADLRSRFAQAGLEHARTNFNNQVNSQLMMQVYDQILAKQ